MTSLKERIVYANSIPETLETLQEKGYRPSSMPELADARGEHNELWNHWFLTRSLRVTGKTKQGTQLVLYHHADNPLATPEGARTAVKKGLVNYAVQVNQDQFESWAEQSVETKEMTSESSIIRVPHNLLKASSSGVIPVSNALAHPQVIPFLGGEARARAYLTKHQQVYTTKNIGVYHSDDLAETPLARLLYLGVNGDGGLDGGNDFINVARFFGVRDGSAAGAQKNAGPTLEDILAIGKTTILHPTDRKNFEETMRERYIK